MESRAQPRRFERGQILIWAGVVLLAVAVGALTLYLSEPAPPRKVILATGSADGAYALFGARLKDAVEAAGGPTVTLAATAGSVENLELLVDGKADLGFVQGGIVSGYRGSLDLEGLRAVARIYSEPLWVFYRATEEVHLLCDLTHLELGRKPRVWVGPAGSGSRPVALELLSRNGVGEDSAELLPAPGSDRARPDLDRTDVIFLVASYQAPIVQELMRDPDLRLLNFVRYKAYARRLPYLGWVSLSRGMFDFAEDLPPQDVVLVAPSATLVTRADTHPRVVELFTRAATRIFAQGNDIDLPGEFPASDGLELPQAEAAHRYLTEGESWASRNLPFWAVRLLSRAKLLLIPLITVLLPAFKLVPVLLRFRVRHLIKMHYESLRDVEIRIREADTPEELRRQLAEAVHLRDELSKLSSRIPGTYQDNLYHWRLHVNLVRQEGEERLRQME